MSRMTRHVIPQVVLIIIFLHNKSGTNIYSQNKRSTDINRFLFRVSNVLIVLELFKYASKFYTALKRFVQTDRS